MDDLLRQVLKDVEDQILKGKGKERHGPQGNLGEQVWYHICDLHGNTDWCLGQAIKKIHEHTRTPAPDRELLQAASYVALAILWRRAR